MCTLDIKGVSEANVHHEEEGIVWVMILAAIQNVSLLS